MAHSTRRRRRSVSGGLGRPQPTASGHLRPSLSGWVVVVVDTVLRSGPRCARGPCPKATLARARSAAERARACVGDRGPACSTRSPPRSRACTPGREQCGDWCRATAGWCWPPRRRWSARRSRCGRPRCRVLASTSSIAGRRWWMVPRGPGRRQVAVHPARSAARRACRPVGTGAPARTRRPPPPPAAAATRRRTANAGLIRPDQEVQVVVLPRPQHHVAVVQQVAGPEDAGPSSAPAVVHVGPALGDGPAGLAPRRGQARWPPGRRPAQARRSASSAGGGCDGRILEDVEQRVARRGRRSPRRRAPPRPARPVPPRPRRARACDHRGGPGPAGPPGARGARPSRRRERRSRRGRGR